MKLYEKKDHLIRKNPNLTEEQKLEIINVLNKYPNLEKNIDWNKNNSLTYEDFKLSILDKAGKTTSQAKKKGISGLVEGQDYDILYSKDGDTLYAVYTHLASKTLASNRVEPKIWTESLVMDWSEEDEFSGRKVYKNEDGELVELKPGAKWCISMNTPDYWENYTSKGLFFFFFFRQDEHLLDKDKKLAISVNLKGKIIDITDASDESDLDYYYSALPKELLEIIEESVSRIVFKKRIKMLGLKLNPDTGRYDQRNILYTHSISTADIRPFVRKDKRGFVINFGDIEADFDCSYLNLISLEGAPKMVRGNFDCSNNQLTTLKGAPDRVYGDFNCSGNQLTSLEGAPEMVGNYFYCYKNQLASLEGAPKEIDGGFECYKNKLTSLKGAPEKVRWDFDCYSNKLTSLKGAPQYIGGYFDCTYNPDLSSLEGIGEVEGEIYKDF